MGTDTKKTTSPNKAHSIQMMCTVEIWLLCELCTSEPQDIERKCNRFHTDFSE